MQADTEGCPLLNSSFILVMEQLLIDYLLCIIFWVIERIYYNRRNNSVNKTYLLITIAIMENGQGVSQKERLEIEP